MDKRKKILQIIFLFVISFGVYHTASSQSSTLTNGLVGYWKFDSINTTALTTPDESGAGNIGTIGTSSRLVTGKFGQALRFDIGGSGQFMTTKNNFASPQWSVSTWVNSDLPIATSSPYFGAYTFFSADQAPSGTSQMLLVTKDDVRTYGGSIGRYSFGNNPGWHHVVVTYDGVSLSAYVDGTLRGSIPYTNILANNIKRYIGTNAGPARGHIFVGAIDETRLYNRVLTAAEITALFNNTTNVVVTAPVASTTTARVATTTIIAPQVLAPVLPVPTTKITTSFTATTDKTTYRLGDTVRMSATVTLDSAWVNYLKTVKGDTKAEVFFEIKDTTTNAFLVQVPIAFDLVNTSVTKTYDWVTPATNTALAGKTFNASFTVRDASKTVTDIKAVNGLVFEALPVPVVARVVGVTDNDGATVDESKIAEMQRIGTSPDIFAGVLATQQYAGNQFTFVRNTTTAFTTATSSTGLFPVIATKTAAEGTFGQYRLTTGSTMDLGGYNVVDFVLENNANVPIEIILQAIGSNDSNYYQAVHLLPARSGARHVLLPLEANLFKCNSVTGTDDCPLSPRQGVVKGGYVIGTPSKSSIREFRVRANNMPQNSTLVLHGMKAMSISYAPQYLRNYIDKYGQNNWVNFPEKVTSDEQLKADARAERTTLRPLPSEWDMYGGDKTATGYGATGKFKVQKVDGKWWLVNPLGNLTYLTAVTQVDYTLTPGYIGDDNSAKRGAYVSLERTGLLSNAFRDGVACHGNGVFCGGTTWSAYTSNIIRKYEASGITFPQIVEKWRLNQANRLREWGFNSITDRMGEYSAGWINGMRNIPFITQFNLKGKVSYKKVPGTNERVPDPFDPAFETEVNRMIGGYFNGSYPGTTTKIKDDPYAIGTAPDNEIPWGLGQYIDVNNHTRETSLTDVYHVVLRVLEQGASQPAKVAFTNMLKEKYVQNFQALRTSWGSVLPSNINSWEAFQNNPITISSIDTNIRADLSFLLKEFALKYMRTTKAAIKTYGGEAHLFTGVRFAGFYRAPREVIDACAEVCDVISINYYDYTTDNTQTNRNNWAYLLAKDKPILITEFYFDAPSRGSAIADRTQTTTDEDQGKAFEAYARSVLSKPQIIGYSYHDMYDQPLLGSIWTENNLTGFVSETDRIYPKLVASAQRVNFDVYNIRGSRPNGNNPTSYAVTVGKTGAGSGTVSGGTIACGQTCQNVFSIGSTVTLTAVPASGSTFVGWTGACTGAGTCTLTMNGDKVVTAEFGVAPQTATLTVAKVGSGTVTGTGISCGTDCIETVNVGTNVTLTATPATGYTFTGWSACTGTGTCTVSMNTAKTATATFTRINTAPTVSAMTVVTTGAPVTFDLAGTDPQGDTLTYTTGVAPTKGTLTRVSEGRYTYTINNPIPTAGFTDGFNYNASDGRLTAASARVTITYTPSKYRLTTSKTGNGTVTGTGISCGIDCSEDYNANSVVVLTATPTTGNTFSGWSGACTGTGTCSVTMNAVKSVSATFNPITYSVNVSKTGNGTVSGGTIACGATCQNIFNSGDTVVLTAVPAATYAFTGWTGACTNTTGTCSLTMNGNKTVTANFAIPNTAPVTQNLTFTIASPGTTASIVLDGTDAQNDPLTFTTGVAPTRGTLLRTAEGRYTYTINTPIPTTGFTDGFNYNASDGRLTSTASRVTIVYTITPPTAYTMTVASVGNGTVTATGINCGTDCQGDFTANTNAVITATPTAGNTFSGWSGACTGTNPTCTVVMNAAKTATATFTKINSAPVASAVNATINTAGTATLVLSATDSDGDTLVYTPGAPTKGTLTRVSEGRYTYTIRAPRPTALTDDRFTYVVSDGRSTSTPATVIVTIPTLPNVPPITLDTDLDGVIDANDLCPNTPATLRLKVDTYGCPRPKITNFDIRPNQAGSLKNIVNAVLGRGRVGQIQFNQPVDLVRDNAELDIDSNIFITEKRVEVRAANVPELNKPATITLYGITEKNPKILRNGVACPPNVCVINSFEQGILTFTVNGF